MLGFGSARKFSSLSLLVN